MEWDKVEVKTEQIIDKDPQTWLLSAIEDSRTEKNFDSALEKLNQARAFAKNDPAILADTYDLETCIYWRQGNKSAAREASRLLREYGNLARVQRGAPRFEIDPRPAYICMDVNPYDDFWYQNWLKSVDYVIKNRNFEIVESLLNYDEYHNFTEKTLAEHATNGFVLAVVRTSKLNLLQALHRGGFNLSACKLSDGQNLLMRATVYNSSPEILEFLINNRINGINDKSNQGWTALMSWANSAQYTTKNFEILINAGANVNATSNGKQTALMLAAGQNDEYKIRLLLESGANVSFRDSNDCDAIFYTDNIDCLRLLIKHGANVNQQYSYSGGKTLLHMAAEQNNVSNIRLLLESGANVSLRDSNGCDAIYYTNDAECLRLLAQHGADVNQQYARENGKTLLHMVAEDNHWHRSSYWKTLLNFGADVNAKDKYGHTPLEYALDHSWTFTAELDLPRALVRKGATVTYGAEQIMRRRKIKRSNLYNNSTNFFFSSWFN